MYKIVNTTPLNMISNKDYKAIKIAIEKAEYSIFGSSKRLGACIRTNGHYILWGEPT